MHAWEQIPFFPSVAKFRINRVAYCTSSVHLISAQIHRFNAALNFMEAVDVATRWKKKTKVTHAHTLIVHNATNDNGGTVCCLVCLCERQI